MSHLGLFHFFWLYRRDELTIFAGNACFAATQLARQVQQERERFGFSVN